MQLLGWGESEEGIGLGTGDPRGVGIGEGDEMETIGEGVDEDGAMGVAGA